jgi:hypothetical protein
MRGRRGAGGTAEAALAADEGGGGERRQQVPRRLVEDIAIGIEQRALAGALVDDLGDPGAADDRAARRQRLVDDEALLAVSERATISFMISVVPA